MSAWATIDKPESINFADILSEERRKNLQVKKENPIVGVVKDQDANVTTKEVGAKADDTSNSSLENQEVKHSDNASAKLQVPLLVDNNQEGVFLNDENDIQEYEIKDIQDNEDYDVSDPLEKELISAASYTYKLGNSGKKIIKCDVVLNEKKNTQKPPPLNLKFELKKEDRFDLESSYKFFKSVKIYFWNEEAGIHEIYNKRESVFNVVKWSCSVLYEFIMNHLLQSINYVLNLGEEAVILHATLDPSSPHSRGERSKKCVIKIFRTEKSHPTYNTQYEELQAEIRRNQLRAKKETSTLVRVFRAGIPCPEIIKLKENIVMMSFIGEDWKPAAKLKYTTLSYPDFVSAYKQVKSMMKRLYEKANLIHGDLTECHILWLDGKCYFIDFGRSVEPNHENAFELLQRDCVNVTTFFGKEIEDIDPPEELFKFITGFYFGDKIVLERMEKVYRMNPHVHHKPEVEFSDDFDAASKGVTKGDLSVENEVDKSTSEVECDRIF